MVERGQAGVGLLFLREGQLREARDLVMLAARDLAGTTDPVLTEIGLTRGHGRVLAAVGRATVVSVGEVLAALRITKQSLSRLLTPLLARGLVARARGRGDRRQLVLSLTEEGRALERRLFECQRERLLAAYRDSGAGAVEGFRRVARALLDAETRGRVAP